MTCHWCRVNKHPRHRFRGYLFLP